MVGQTARSFVAPRSTMRVPCGDRNHPAAIWQAIGMPQKLPPTFTHVVHELELRAPGVVHAYVYDWCRVSSHLTQVLAIRTARSPPRSLIAIISAPVLRRLRALRLGALANTGLSSRP